ncbi:MAG: hypothetical protein AB7Q27_26040, partial [Acidimicrobiia bacterium]
ATTLAPPSSSVTASEHPSTSADVKDAVTDATEVDGGGGGTAIFVGTILAVVLLGAVAAVQVRRRR